MHFGLHLIWKVIKKEIILIQHAYPSRVLKLDRKVCGKEWGRGRQIESGIGTVGVSCWRQEEVLSLLEKHTAPLHGPWDCAQFCYYTRRVSNPACSAEIHKVIGSFVTFETCHFTQINVFGSLKQLLSMLLFLQPFTDGCPPLPRENCNYQEVSSFIFHTL